MTAEVGNGQVAIFPVFKGFRRAVLAEVDGSSADGAKRFQTGFSRAGADTGRSTGQGFKRAFQDSAKGAADATVKQMTSEVSKAASAVSAARLKEQDAAGKVRVAELQLAEARKKYGAESSQVAAREERLATLQRALATAQDGTKASSDRLADAQSKLKTATENAARASEQAVTQTRSRFAGLASIVSGAGSVISSGFSGAMGVVQKVGAAAAEGVKRAFSAAASAVSTAMKVTAGAVTAALGVTLASGFKRLANIEDAQASLKGLGFTGQQVSEVMKNALASVKGTAFGLGDAAKVASSAVAAGVKPGADLTRTLKLVASAAAIAKTDMGSMGAIFNKVAASNKVQMDVINQLHDAGIPALALLAKQLGVTADQASEMASRGEIDFATFQAAMEAGLGDGAIAAADTTTGAFKNMLASLSRIGAGLLSGVFPLFKSGIQTITQALAPLEDKAAEVGKKVGELLKPGFDKVVDFIAKVASSPDPFGTLLAGVKSLPGPFGVILQVVETLWPVFRDDLLPALQQAADDILPAVSDALGEVDWASFAKELADVVVQLTPFVLQLLPPLAQLLAQVIPFLASLLALLTDDSSGSSALQVILEVVVTLLTWIVDNLAGWFGAVNSLIGLFSGKLTSEEFLQQARDLPGIFGVIGRAILDLTNGARDFGVKIGTFMRQAATNVGNGVISIRQWFVSLPGTIAGALSGIGSWLLKSGQALIQGFIDGIGSMIEKAKSGAKSVVDAVARFFPHSPAKEGPFSGRGWTLYSGQAIGDDLARGMEGSQSRVRRAADAVMSAAQISAAGSLTSAGTGGAGSGASRLAGALVSIGQMVVADPREAAQAIQSSQRRALSLELEGLVVS